LVFTTYSADPLASISCRCTRDTAVSTTYTVSYTYTLKNSSIASWVAAYTSVTPICNSYIDSHPIVVNTSLFSPPLDLILGSSYFCFIYEGDTNDCAKPYLSGYTFQCTDGFVPAPDSSPPVDTSGPIIWSPLGIGLAVAVLLLFIIVGIIAFVVYKKKQQEKEVA